MVEVRNTIRFAEGTDGAILEIADHYEEPRTITDPISKRTKVVHTLNLIVKSVNGQPVDSVYSVIGDKEYAMWSPWLVGKGYIGRRFKVTKTGSGFTRETSIDVIP